MISIEWIRRLNLVIFVLTHLNRQYNLPLNEVIRNGHFSEEGLRRVVNILITNGRFDLVVMIYETMEGKFTRLKEFEQNLLPFRTHFYSRRGYAPPDHGWPQLLYNYTRNGLPIHQETRESDHTAQETQGHSHRQNSRDERVGVLKLFRIKCA